jgi:hypothetical protein
MRSLLAVLSALSISLLQTSTLGTPADVSALRVGAPTIVAELDLGKLKGELRQIGWSSDAGELYVETAEGKPPAEKLRHFTIPLGGGVPAPLERQPDWANTYWAFKSDRFAPGIGSLIIDVDQKYETMKFGTGSAGAADRSSSGLGADNINVGSNVEKAAESQKVHVVRLTLVGETISEFVNEAVIPGLMFSWGPTGSGAIAFTDRDGRLFLFDQKKHKQPVAGAKDALLPAWTMDGSRLAWAQKSGRKKYTLVYVNVSRG